MLEKEVMRLNVNEAVRLRIFDLCDKRSLTVNKLSIMSGMTQSTVQNITSGRNKTTSISTIKKLCDGLDITIQDFFDSDLFRDLEQEIK